MRRFLIRPVSNQSQLHLFTGIITAVKKFFHVTALVYDFAFLQNIIFKTAGQPESALKPLEIQFVFHRSGFMLSP